MTAFCFLGAARHAHPNQTNLQAREKKSKKIGAHKEEVGLAVSFAVKMEGWGGFRSKWHERRAFFVLFRGNIVASAHTCLLVRCVIFWGGCGWVCVVLFFYLVPGMLFFMLSYSCFLCWSHFFIVSIVSFFNTCNNTYYCWDPSSWRPCLLDGGRLCLRERGDQAVSADFGDFGDVGASTRCC